MNIENQGAMRWAQCSLVLWLLGRGIPVFAGGKAGVLFESTIEIGGIVETALHSNFQNGGLVILIQQH